MNDRAEDFIQWAEDNYDGGRVKALIDLEVMDQIAEKVAEFVRDIEPVLNRLDVARDVRMDRVQRSAFDGETVTMYVLDGLTSMLNLSAAMAMIEVAQKGRA